MAVPYLPPELLGIIASNANDKTLLNLQLVSSTMRTGTWYHFAERYLRRRSCYILGEDSLWRLYRILSTSRLTREVRTVELTLKLRLQHQEELCFSKLDHDLLSLVLAALKVTKHIDVRLDLCPDPATGADVSHDVLREIIKTGCHVSSMTLGDVEFEPEALSEWAPSAFADVCQSLHSLSYHPTGEAEAVETVIEILENATNLKELTLMSSSQFVFDDIFWFGNLLEAVKTSRLEKLNIGSARQMEVSQDVLCTTLRQHRKTLKHLKLHGMSLNAPDDYDAWPAVLRAIRCNTELESLLLRNLTGDDGEKLSPVFFNLPMKPPYHGARVFPAAWWYRTGQATIQSDLTTIIDCDGLS